MTIKSVKENGKTRFRLVSKKGRNLGTFNTKHEAHVREGQVQAFKRRKRGK